jgi:hypothetical protein
MALKARNGDGIYVRLMGKRISDIGCCHGIVRCCLVAFKAIPYICRPYE